MKDMEIKKYIKKVQTDSDKKVKHYLDLLHEQTEDRLKGIKEGIGSLHQKFERVEKTLDAQTETLDAHGNQIANLMMDMMEVKRDVKEIKFDVKIGLDKKVDKKHFVDLEGRVRVLEKA